MDTQSGLCCALTEIGGISVYSSPRIALRETLDDAGSTNGLGRIVIFTGAHRRQRTPARYAERFKTFIQDNKLGKVQTAKPVKNTTGNWVTVYLWAIDHGAVDKWVQVQNHEDD